MLITLKRVQMKLPIIKLTVTIHGQIGRTPTSGTVCLEANCSLV